MPRALIEALFLMIDPSQVISRVISLLFLEESSSSVLFALTFMPIDFRYAE